MTSAESITDIMKALKCKPSALGAPIIGQVIEHV